MSAVIEARGLTKRFGDLEVVRGIDFSIPPGVCFGILGPNGAGKTTTLRMILGLSPVTSGRLTLFGEEIVTAGPRLRRRVGVVPQNDNLDPDFTVEENLWVYGRYFGIDEKTLRERTRELLEFVELTEKARVRIEQLSGGMRRRLTIARALINDPELVILDEPTTGLDPQVRHALWGRLRELLRRGKTLLLTTHYMDEAERLCNRLIIMDHGRILAEGSPKELIAAHLEPEVVEIRGDGAAALGDSLEGLDDCRFERVGDMLYCYSGKGRALLSRLEGRGDLIFLHRPANLEDLFLKLTGRDLR